VERVEGRVVGGGEMVPSIRILNKTRQKTRYSQEEKKIVKRPQKMGCVTGMKLPGKLILED
jgi:hypothetical protein